MKKILIFVIGMVLISSCASYKYISIEPEARDVYIGAPSASVIRAKGAPNREVSDGNGGKILIYENYYSNSSTYYYGYGISNTSTQQKRNFMEFYMDKDDICYDVRTNMANREVDWGKTMVGYLAILTIICLIIPFVIKP